jgi:nucleotide-binding universal stress UspA family protein
VCPVDFSDGSRLALAHAAAIARWYEAELTVLHVFTERVPVDVIPALALRPPRPPIQPSVAQRQTVARELHQFVTQSDVEGLAVEEVTQEAPDLVMEILAQAAVRHADLLVLGSHGRSGVQRLLLGSIAEKLLRTAEIPTLIVPAHADHVGFARAAPFKRILCPIDFSASSLDALAMAMMLGEEADSDLTLLHVIDMPPELVEAALVANLPLADVHVKIETSCHERLEALVPDAVRTYSTVRTVVAHGRPAREILRAAAEQQSNLIVMGVHGRGGIDLLLFGSKTHEVIRSGQYPVLTVRGSTGR